MLLHATLHMVMHAWHGLMTLVPSNFGATHAAPIIMVLHHCVHIQPTDAGCHCDNHDSPWGAYPELIIGEGGTVLMLPCWHLSWQSVAPCRAPSSCDEVCDLPVASL